jgi:hypothetical protein
MVEESKAMTEEKGNWHHPRLSDRDLLLCIGRDLKRIYEDTLRQSLPSDIEALLQKIEQADLERTVREQ